MRNALLEFRPLDINNVQNLGSIPDPSPPLFKFIPNNLSSTYLNSGIS